MAVGVACAGTGMRAAMDLLEPLLGDAVDFVRQGALIASALVLMQQPEAKARRPPAYNTQLNIAACLSDLQNMWRGRSALLFFFLLGGRPHRIPAVIFW